MRSFEIHLGDWARLLFGNVPPLFLVEVAFRVVFVFVLIVFCMRSMGKRLSAQLDRNELLAVSALAAAIGMPIQTPDRGLLPALLAAFLVVGIQRLVASRAARNETFESWTQGGISTLIQDGVLQAKALQKAHISRERIFAQLRTSNIGHLGHVSRLYFEADGGFSLIKAVTVKPGLTVLPEKDPEFRAEQRLAAVNVCSYCGNAAPPVASSPCANCGHTHFVAAVDAAQD